MLKRSFQMTFLGLAAALFLTVSASTAAAQEIYVTETLTSFTPQAGNPAILQQVQQRMQQGVWALYPNGQFLFTTLTDLQTGGARQIGTYSRRGASVSFSGMSGSYINGTQVYGSMNLNGTPSVDMNAFQIGTGAGVGVGGGLGFNSITQYRVRATLRRVN